MLVKPDVRSVPTAPLNEFVRAQFDTDCDAAAALGLKLNTVRAWRHRPTISVFNADRVAVALGCHPFDIWGWAWYEIPDLAPRSRPALTH